jgi:probable phosphoglycerate mutase
MRRAIQTAEPFAAAAGLDVATHEAICEYDRGTGVYIPSEELKREDYAAWQAVLDHDLTEFHDLVVDALEAIVRQNQGRRVAVFCHGGVINVWTAHVLKMSPRMFFNPTYASVSRFSCARTGQRSVITLNESHHLSELAADVAR